MFIYTPTGYRNLSAVQEAQRKPNGRYRLLVNNQIVDEDNVTFGEVIVSVVPSDGTWRCLIKSEKDGALEILEEPVVAWGLTILGTLKPITPSEMGGVEGNYALAKQGTQKVYDTFSIGGYEDRQAWIDAAERVE